MVPPWARGVFELIRHDEQHLRDGGDFDRRMALISFDNAVEVAIGNYLSLNPIQRGGRSYPKEQVAKWLDNFHTRVEFLETECGARGVAMLVSRAELVWYHGIRSDQYHAGRPTTPHLEDLRALRRACLWVFSFLYELDGVEAHLDQCLAPPPPPKPLVERDENIDALIDELYSEIVIGDFRYRPSEVLYGYDPNAYREFCLSLGAAVEAQRSA